jgi:thiol-disulfide isomerase/thioredoxin
MNRRDCLGGFAAFAVLGGTTLAGPARAQSMRKSWPHNRATPPLKLFDVDGRPWNLAQERGHPVLLNFWATWCEPCRAEMPSLQRLAQEHEDAGLRVVAVNFREGEPAVRRFLASASLDLPVVRDADGSAARAFGVRIFPSTIAIDRGGRARFVVVGEFDWDGEAGEKAIRPLL